MEPLYRRLVVGLVPQPSEVPPAPFNKEDLQRVFFDVSQDYPYQQFHFLPGESGMQLTNSPEDLVVIQPGLFQVQAPVDLTPERAREKAVDIQKIIATRLRARSFLVAGIKVVAHVPAPGDRPDAKAFVTDQLMREAGAAAQDLGPDFFGGAIRYRALADDNLREEVLSIEPFVNDNSYIFVDYDVQRRQPFQDLDVLADWIDEAFSFVSGPTMRILEERAA